MTTIGDRLKILRNYYKFTQKQLGDYLGFDQSHIAKLENNKRNLTTDTLDDLCKLYNCSEKYILKGYDNYDMPQLNYRSNLRSLDLNTVASMNPIIKNMAFLNSILDNEKDCKSIYNSKLIKDVFSRAINCRRIWNIGEYDPIDIISVCLNKFDNITIVFIVANDNMSGSSLSVNGEWIIFINSNHSLGRQRFTIAHELYHLLFGENEFVNCSVDNSKTKEELEADEFASYLLMSEEALLNYRLENGIETWDLDSILGCEQYFQISRRAMLKRLENLVEDVYNDKFTKRIKYHAKKRGFSDNLYVPYSRDDNLLMGSYIKLTQKAYDREKITKGKKDELLRDAYYYDFLNNENMEDLFVY